MLKPVFSARKCITTYDPFSAAPSGAISYRFDLSQSLAALAEFISMSAVYQRVLVTRVRATIVSNLHQYNSAVPGPFYAVTVAFGYSPTDSAMPTTYVDCLNCQVATLHTSTSPPTPMNFRPLVNSGVQGPQSVALYTNAGFIGYIRAAAPAGAFPASAAAFTLFIVYDAEFFYAE